MPTQETNVLTANEQTAPMKIEMEVHDDFADRVVVASLADALSRAKKRTDADSKKYAKALVTVLEWYTPPSEHHKLALTTGQ